MDLYFTLFVLLVALAVAAGGIDDRLAVGMPVRSPVDELIVRQLSLVFPVCIDHEQLQQIVALPVGAKNDPHSIRADERPGVRPVQR